MVDLKPQITYEDFTKIDIRVGEIIHADVLTKARKPSIVLQIDFGSDVGQKTSSAQITECYSPEELIGKQVMAVINFAPRNIAGFVSEVLVLGIYAKQGVVLLKPEQMVAKGDIIG